MRRLAFVTPVLALGWLAWAAFRPLPRPGAHEPPASPSVARFSESAVPMSERENLLASVTAGNVFAPDRHAWPVVADGGAALPESAAGATQRGGPSAARADGQPVDTSRRGRDAGTAAQAGAGGSGKLKGITLRAVYNLGKGPVAIIERTGDKEGPRTERVPQGESTVDGAWEVVRIDESLDEVTVRGEGGEHLLQMYGPSARLAHDEVTTHVGAPARNPGAPLTEKEVRAELAKAGLSAQEIDELVRLALSDDAGDLAALEAAVAKTEPAAPQAEGAQEAAPSGLGSILQLMKGDPFGPDDEAKARRGGDEGAQERRERARRAREKSRTEQGSPQ